MTWLFLQPTSSGPLIRRLKLIFCTLFWVSEDVFIKSSQIGVKLPKLRFKSSIIRLNAIKGLNVLQVILSFCDNYQFFFVSEVTLMFTFIRYSKLSFRIHLCYKKILSPLAFTYLWDYVYKFFPTSCTVYIGSTCIGLFSMLQMCIPSTPPPPTSHNWTTFWNVGKNSAGISWNPSTQALRARHTPQLFATVWG